MTKYKATPVNRVDELPTLSLIQISAAVTFVAVFSSIATLFIVYLISGLSFFEDEAQVSRVEYVSESSTVPMCAALYNQIDYGALHIEELGYMPICAHDGLLLAYPVYSAVRKEGGDPSTMFCYLREGVLYGECVGDLLSRSHNP